MRSAALLATLLASCGQPSRAVANLDGYTIRGDLRGTVGNAVTAVAVSPDGAEWFITRTESGFLLLPVR